MAGTAGKVRTATTTGPGKAFTTLWSDLAPVRALPRSDLGANAVAEQLGRFGSGDDERWRGEPRAMDYLQRGQSSRIRSHATVSHVSGRCGQEFFDVVLVPESWLVF